VTIVGAFTLPAVTGKTADVEPGSMVTIAGTLAAIGFELESDITATPALGGPVRLTVPAPDSPLAIPLGLTEMLRRADDTGLTGLTVRPDLTLTPA